MTDADFIATEKDHATYTKGSWDEGGFVASGFWVDDFIGIGDGEHLGALADSVDRKYGITGLGKVRWLLGMLVERDREPRAIYVLQGAFIDSALARFHLSDAARLSVAFNLSIICWTRYATSCIAADFACHS